MPPLKPFTLLIKPASADCNLRCDYCFYLDKCRLYPQTTVHRMTEEVLERVIEGYMATEQPVYAFGWQGGEPTLMGVDFFRKATRFQEAHGRPGVRVGNGLQTNATLINEDLAQHFYRYRFLLGCSLDGPAEIHDRYRRTIGGRPSHAKVLAGLEMLKRHQVEFNILTLVSRANVLRPLDVYRYLVNQGFLFHQYIPCVEFDEQGHSLPFSINGQEWGTFLCEIFDEWYRRDRYRVSIRYFDAILYKMLEGGSNVCHMDHNCCQYFVVEHNGDIYPCDFFVEPSLKLGNVMANSWPEILKSKVYREFGAQKARWNQACQACDCLDLCSGDCLKYRVYAGNSPRNPSLLCSGWKQFIGYTRDRFAGLVAEIRQRRQTEKRPGEAGHHRQALKKEKIGRNDPCPCGSGKKFKKCCGAGVGLRV